MTNLNHETIDGSLVLKPSRRIDSSSAKAFEDEASALVDAGPKKVVIDASDLDYISSAGLRVILTTAKKAKAEEKTDAPLGCSYVFTRGNNLGKRCGTGQVVGTEFCSKHQDKAVKKTEKKDAVPKPKATAESKPKNVFVADASGRLVMKGDLPLVCKSAQEKLIIGKIEDDEIVPLTEEDKKVCDERNLKYEVSSKKKIDKALEDVLDEVMGEEEELEEDHEDPEDPDYEPEEVDDGELLEEDE